MSPSIDKNYNRPLSDDEIKRVIRTGAVLFALAFIFMTTLTLMVHYDTIRLHPSSMDTDMVKGYAGRVEYTLRFQTLLVAWLMFNVIATIYFRASTKSILNPLEEKREQRVQWVKNVLTNSFEQIVLSVFAQLIYISFASPECILKVIPLVNIIQLVGRIAFFAGYPLKRSFGFLCTMIPTIVLISYDVYMFLSFLGLY